MLPTLIALLLALPGAAASAVSGSDLFSGKPIAIASGNKGTVVLFLSASCPCSGSHIEPIKKLAKEFMDFNFVAVHSNTDEPLEQAQAYFKGVKLPFPVLKDDKSQLANRFKAIKTPHAFVLSPGGQTVFKGGVTSSQEGSAEAEQHLRAALLDLQAGREVKKKEARTLGCAISRS